MMQVTNEVWRREGDDGRIELAVALFTPDGVVVTYTSGGGSVRQQVVRTEEFDGRNDGDSEIIETSLANMGYQLALETRFLV